MSRMRKTRKKKALAIQVATAIGAAAMTVSPAEAGKTKNFKNSYFSPQSGQNEGQLKVQVKKVSKKKRRVKARCRRGPCGGFKKVSAKLKKVGGDANNFQGSAKIDGEKCQVLAQIFKDGVFYTYSCPSALAGGQSAFKNPPSDL